MTGQVVVTLHGTTGTGAGTVLTRADDIDWDDPLRGFGTSSFRIPAADAATAGLTPGMVVKYALDGTTVTGGRITRTRMQHAVDGAKTVRVTCSADVTTDGTVLPEYGVNSFSSAERRFGPMSLDGPWRIAAEWAYTIHSWRHDSTDDVDNRPAKSPEGFPVPHARWLAPVTGSTGDTVTLRLQFTTATPRYARWHSSADESYTLWWRGEPITTQHNTEYGYEHYEPEDVFVPAGTHVVMAQYVLEAQTDVSTSGRDAFLAALVALSSIGELDNVLAYTGPSTWLMNVGGDLGWHPGQILARLWSENAAQNVRGATMFAATFTESLDSDGAAWSAERVDLTFGVGVDSLSKVTEQLVALDLMDVWLDWQAMTINALPERGTDKTATVALTVGTSSQNVASHETDLLDVAGTSLLMQLANGRWVTRTDTAALAAYGRRYVGLRAGSTEADPTAVRIADAQLAEDARQALEAGGTETLARDDLAPLVGAKAYADYGPGDTITAPGYDGTPAAFRVVGITARQDQGTGLMQFFPELVEV